MTDIWHIDYIGKIKEHRGKNRKTKGLGFQPTGRKCTVGNKVNRLLAVKWNNIRTLRFLSPR